MVTTKVEEVIGNDIHYGVPSFEPIHSFDPSILTNLRNWYFKNRQLWFLRFLH